MYVKIDQDGPMGLYANIRWVNERYLKENGVKHFRP